METPDTERHEFVFMGRRILEYVSGPWTLPGNIPMFPADINEKLRVRFPRGSAWDIIGWNRFQPVENLQVVMESVVHAVLAQPIGEVTWPTPLPEPVTKTPSGRTFHIKIRADKNKIIAT